MEQVSDVLNHVLVAMYGVELLSMDGGEYVRVTEYGFPGFTERGGNHLVLHHIQAGTRHQYVGMSVCCHVHVPWLERKHNRIGGGQTAPHIG